RWDDGLDGEGKCRRWRRPETGACSSTQAQLQAPLERIAGFLRPLRCATDERERQDDPHLDPDVGEVEDDREVGLGEHERPYADEVDYCAVTKHQVRDIPESARQQQGERARQPTALRGKPD